MKKVFILLQIAAAGVLLSQVSFGQALYSYQDESGARVFTNFAPTSPVSDLKMIGSPPVPNTPLSSPNPKAEAYTPIIEKYAGDYRVDPSLIQSIIAVESGFNPKAVSPKGARGLMQLMPETAKRLGVDNSFDPEQNIQGGVKHFRSLLDTFNGDISLSLAAFNAGENLVKVLGRIPNIRETKDYVQSITKKYDKKKSEQGVQNNENERPTVMYRYYDESGALHLTNIPPVR